MELILSNGERVEIYRQNCGYEEGNSTKGCRSWDIDPLEIIATKKPGFFVLGAKWGSGYRRFAGRLIPVSNVIYIDRPCEWEA